MAVFDAERRRMTHAGRWTRERSRWLKVAATVGAPTERIARLASAPISAEVVSAAEALYTTTVERSFRAARRIIAGRTPRASAASRRKSCSGSPARRSRRPTTSSGCTVKARPPQLRGIEETTRQAELVSAGCCDACRADGGQTFKISLERRAPRLPHAGCPKGLCRCDWSCRCGTRRWSGDSFGEERALTKRPDARRVAHDRGRRQGGGLRSARLPVHPEPRRGRRHGRFRQGARRQGRVRDRGRRHPRGDARPDERTAADPADRPCRRRPPILVYRVADHRAAVAELKKRGWSPARSLEIPRDRAARSGRRAATGSPSTNWRDRPSWPTSRGAATSEVPAPAVRALAGRRGRRGRRGVAGTDES